MPFGVWASRQIVWFGFFLFWTVLTAIFLLVCTAAGNSWLELQFWEDFGLIVGIAILCYASSQVCSLAIRSGLVALACAAFASLQVVGWAVLMWQLGVSLWLSVVPLPVFLLWATWLVLTRLDAGAIRLAFSRAGTRIPVAASGSDFRRGCGRSRV